MSNTSQFPTNIISFDLEATWFGNFVIQIGAQKLQIVDGKPVVVDTFNEYVKPSRTSCKVCKQTTKFTGITPEMVASADEFPAVLGRFLAWIGDDYKLCCWSKDDKKMFRHMCTKFELDDSWLTEKNYVDIQTRMTKIVNLPKGQQLGLKRAISILNISLVGKTHDAFVDAMAVSCIIMQKFGELNLTN